MDQAEANSWLRRTKFSHTVYHRWDASRLPSNTFMIEPFILEHNSGLKSRPKPSSSSDKKPALNNSTSYQKSALNNCPLQQNHTLYKQRASSPIPVTIVPDLFKEARSNQKRFSTPDPQIKREIFKGIKGKLFNTEPQVTGAIKSTSSPNTRPQIDLGSMMKVFEKPKNRKESTWTKYFDYGGGGRVTALETTSEWNVDLSKLFLGLRFAHGAHSRLYHGVYNYEPVAVKIIRIPDDDENGAMEVRLEKQFLREVTLLSQLHHPNVIKFVAACREPPVYCVITEYLSGGSLGTYIQKHDKSLPLQKLIAIALDIARGMEYIHSQGVIHRDLKPGNVLVDQENHLKVADFGIACEEAYCDLLASDPGTYRWMAPEMIKQKSYGRKVDVYSFGLILWEMFAGKIPYEDMNPIQAAFAVISKNLRPIIPSDCPPALRDLINQCWALQPKKRPEFWQIVNVLEHFESSLARDGTLSPIQNPTCQDHKKGLLHWIQKLGSTSSHTSP